MSGCQSITSIILLASLIPIGWAFEMACNPSKVINQPDQTIAIDAMKIEYKSKVEATRYLRNTVRKDSVFPWHKISFEGSFIDTQNNIITELGHTEVESSILTFNNQRVLRFQNKSDSFDTISCEMTFQHNDRAPKSSNLPYGVYLAIVKEAEACIQDYMCKYTQFYQQTKAQITEAKTINAIVDFGVGNIIKYISTNRTVPASIENLGYSMSSITFNEDTELKKVSELSIKMQDANNMIVKGFYDLTANFSLNNVSVSVYSAEELPIKVTGLQVAFEVMMKITQKTCIFTLKELQVFNLAEVAEIDFRGKRSQQGWSLGSWLGSALNVISSTNFLQIKDRVYSMLMFFVDSEIKAAVEKFNWETYVTKIVAATKNSFEKFQVENMEEIRKQRAQKTRSRIPRSNSRF